MLVKPPATAEATNILSRIARLRALVASPLHGKEHSAPRSVAFGAKRKRVTRFGRSLVSRVASVAGLDGVIKERSGISGYALSTRCRYGCSLIFSFESEATPAVVVRARLTTTFEPLRAFLRALQELLDSLDLSCCSS